MASIRFFTAPGCDSCSYVKSAIDNGTVTVEGVGPESDSPDIEVVDVSTDQGFPMIEEYDLEEVPSVYYGMKKCDLFINEETREVTVHCETEHSDVDQTAATPPGPLTA